MFHVTSIGFGAYLGDNGLAPSSKYGIQKSSVGYSKNACACVKRAQCRLIELG